MSTQHRAPAQAPRVPRPRRAVALGPGSVVDDYRIEGVLGQGGMGVVHEATQLSLQRRVALKMMAERHLADEQMRMRFTREARVQAGLSSAHVVQVHAHGEHDGRLWTAAELIPGGSLADSLRSDGPPPLSTALDLLAQVALGVADAHDAGIVHRDLKPANVLLRRRRHLTAHVADFGIARTEDSETTQAGVVCGTPSFMAPELHHGEGASVASDIYALGCLLWALLAGSAPYSWSTGDYQLMTAHISAPVPALPGKEPGVRRINRVLARAMAKDPAVRFRSAMDMRAAVLALS